MPASLQDIQRRITSTKKTGQITGAMQMVSTAKLSQIQRHTAGYQAYVTHVKAVVAHLAQAHVLANAQGELLEVRPINKTGILVVTSDRGLVGSYNSTVLKQTLDLIAKKHLTPANTEILAVGGVGADFFKKRGFNVTYEYRGVSDVPQFMEIREIVKAVIAMFASDVFDELTIAYNHFVNRISNEYRVMPMLPITEDTLQIHAEQTGETASLASYEMDPSPEAILKAVLPQYVEAMLYGAILDAKTAEHAASANAMRSATDNAKDVISSLELQFNRARQAAITTEITEITGGMAALD
ncbi:F0F1 ATP synthase subunit gamma [Periweissella ghanensis]|uniref:ATP synthase gamma chain n=1 Tax=Periweissella ghanensis TaxID=467997 RepID=A0ABN8BPW6_9LACO|nr:F0F1 ATP synthase subunit gamma [Periweissella ghanensis]MCM0601575.1 F0F1 ATP synthase subunit gamma [Periweissella ghanensis]CAH0418652.1 ATP synthase gamma chain [Periweissella ghanensis]